MHIWQPLPAVEHGTRRNPEEGHLLGRGGRRVGFPAVRADDPDEALGQDSPDRRRQEEILHAEVQESRDGAGCVVGVEGGKDEVPGEGRLDGDLCRLQVADLADHDDVGVLADDVAQGAGEGEPDLGLHLDLVDPADLVFHRVFHGDDLLVGRVDPVESPVEGGGLAASRGPRHEQDPVGLVDELLEDRKGCWGKAQAVQVDHDPLAVENTHDHALAIQDGDGRDPQVDLPLAHLEPDPAVLGQPSLGDVELRHDLHAGDDGGLEPLGDRLDVVQDAVNPVAHLQVAFEGLDVDVACPAFDGMGDEEVDELDDGGLRCEVLEVSHILFRFAQNPHVPFIDILDDLPDILRLLAVVPGQVFVDDAALAGVDKDVGIQCGLQGIHQRPVVRVGHDNFQDIVLEFQGNDPVFPDKAGGDSLQDKGHYREILLPPGSVSSDLSRHPSHLRRYP